MEWLSSSTPSRSRSSQRLPLLIGAATAALGVLIILAALGMPLRVLHLFNSARPANDHLGISAIAITQILLFDTAPTAVFICLIGALYLHAGIDATSQRRRTTQLHIAGLASLAAAFITIASALMIDASTPLANSSRAFSIICFCIFGLHGLLSLLFLPPAGFTERHRLAILISGAATLVTGTIILGLGAGIWM